MVGACSEVACGTGFTWTEVAARSAQFIVATDFNEECARSGAGKIHFQVLRNSFVRMRINFQDFNSAFPAEWLISELSHVPESEARFFCPEIRFSSRSAIKVIVYRQ